MVKTHGRMLGLKPVVRRSNKLNNTDGHVIKKRPPTGDGEWIGKRCQTEKDLLRGRGLGPLTRKQNKCFLLVSRSTW